MCSVYLHDAVWWIGLGCEDGEAGGSKVMVKEYSRIQEQKDKEGQSNGRTEVNFNSA